jgi:hypothetical protein
MALFFVQKGNHVAEGASADVLRYGLMAYTLFTVVVAIVASFLPSHVLHIHRCPRRPLYSLYGRPALTPINSGSHKWALSTVFTQLTQCAGFSH